MDAIEKQVRAGWDPPSDLSPEDAAQEARSAQLTAVLLPSVAVGITIWVTSVSPDFSSAVPLWVPAVVLTVVLVPVTSYVLFWYMVTSTYPRLRFDYIELANNRFLSLHGVVRIPWSTVVNHEITLQPSKHARRGQPPAAVGLRIDITDSKGRVFKGRYPASNERYGIDHRFLHSLLAHYFNAPSGSSAGSLVGANRVKG